MKELRITKASMVEAIRQYRGKFNGVAILLKDGGIDPDKEYKQNLDPATGDYIITQEKKKPKKAAKAKKEPIVKVKTPKAVEVDKKAKWTENFTSPTKKKAKKGKK